jgi:hypothetical protein
MTRCNNQEVKLEGSDQFAIAETLESRRPKDKIAGRASESTNMEGIIQSHHLRSFKVDYRMDGIFFLSNGPDNLG